MRISTETLGLAKYGNIFEIVKLIKDAGFDAYDFTMYSLSPIDCFIDKEDYKERAKSLREYADSIGIVCNQTHSFFPTIRPNDEEWNKKGIDYTIKSLEVASILGSKYCIVHPVNDYDAERNQKMYMDLLPYAKKFGVTICLENMWNWDHLTHHVTDAACSNEIDFNKHLDLLPEGEFGACLDIGHAEMDGVNTSAVQMIKSLGKRLTNMHLHDNDKIHDSHRLPFTYDIKFEPIIDALAEINYQGDITFEAVYYVERFPKKLYLPALKLMCEIGKYFRDEVELRKKK